MGSIINKKNRSDINTCIKRCSAEMLDLYECYDFDSIQIKLFSSSEIHFIIKEFGGKILKFILSDRYPFIEPKLMINDQFYKNNILQNSKCYRINKVLKNNFVDAWNNDGVFYSKGIFNNLPNWEEIFKILNKSIRNKDNRLSLSSPNDYEIVYRDLLAIKKMSYDNNNYGIPGCSGC
jgi:hypothetical protein